METTINRPGQVTQLTHKDQKNACVVSFKGGYAKFFYDKQDFPDMITLQDKVEVSFLFKIKDDD